MSISRLTLQSGRALRSGGGIFSHEDLILEDVTLNGNEAEQGGGIATGTGGSLKIFNSTVQGNRSSADANEDEGGGGIYAGSPLLVIVNSTISGNTTHGWGGGLLITGGNPLLSSVTISDNTADFDRDSAWPDIHQQKR